MHWADVVAKEVADTCDHPLIATGISPTGIIHVGSLREAITGESVRSAVEGLGKEVRLIYLIDSFDPLRKRYDFLPEEFEKYVGMPISRIPRGMVTTVPKPTDACRNTPNRITR